MQEYLDLLLSMPLFQGIEDRKNLAWVLKCVDGTVKEFAAGEAIYEIGEDVYFAGMLMEGAVLLEGSSEEPRKVNASELIPIPYSGEKSAKSPWKVTAESNCRILFMRWIRLMKVCNFECGFHKQLLENLENMTEQK